MSEKTCGIIYMAFGNNAVKSVENSISTIRALNIDLPVATVGSHKIQHTIFIPWLGHAPWTEDTNNADQRFRAGYVKPFLHRLSPFDYTLYLDADTVIHKDIMPGFEFLEDYDICAAYGDKDRTLGRSKNHFSRKEFSTPFFEDARKELSYTCKSLGKDTPIMNSGVIFFRKSVASSDFFERWYLEWLRFKGWEEQHAFLRAERVCAKTKILHLSFMWNQKQSDPETIIWHKMNSGDARDPKPKEI